MKHNEIDTGMLRAYLDGEVNGDRVSALTEHVSTCSECQAELKVLSGHAASARAGLDFLPQPVAAGVAPAWSAMRLRLEQPAASAPGSVESAAHVVPGGRWSGCDCCRSGIHGGSRSGMGREPAFHLSHGAHRSRGTQSRRSERTGE